MRGCCIWVIFSVALAVSIPLSVTEGSSPKVDPETGKIRIIHFGAGGFPSRVYPYDPMFKFAWVPAYMFGMGREEVQRSLRIYMPRSYSLLVQNDVLVFDDTCSSNYRDLWLVWCRDAVLKDKLGLVMTAGGESFGGVEGYGVGYVGTPLEELLPVQMYHQMTWALTHLPNYSLPWEITDNDHVLTSGLPYDTAPVLGPQNYVTEKQGAHILAMAKEVPGRNERWPVWTYADIEQSRTMAFTAYMWESRHGLQRFDMWEYFLDHVSNMLYYTCRLGIPDDVQMVHQIRDSFREYVTRKVFAHNLMEFIQRFGANTQRLELRIGDSDEVKKEAEDLYVKQEYQASYDRIQEAISEMKEIALDSGDLKKAALMWVYVTEYLTVSGTCMVTGFILWTLMVRRKLYRAVATTRAA